MGREINDRYLHILRRQIFRDFQSDKSTAHDHCPTDLSSLHSLPKHICVLRRSHIKYIFQLRARAIRLEGTRARGNHQLIIRIGFDCSRIQIHSLHGFPFSVYFCHFSPDFHRHSGYFFIRFRRMHQQILFFPDHAAHIIRKTAARIGNILSLCQDPDVRISIFPLQLGCSLGSGCYTAHYNDLHFSSPFLIHFRYSYYSTCLSI